MPSLSHPAVIAGLGLAAIVIAIMLNLDEGEDVRPAPPAVTAGAESGAEPESAPSADSAQQPESEAEASALPAFDVVRVGPDGGAVMAGRAAPGAVVEIRRGETVLGEVSADSRGEWVFVPEKPLAPGETVFSLAMRTKNGDAPVFSKENVLVIVPETARPADAPVALKISPDGTTRLLNRPEPQPGAGAEPQFPVLAIETVDYGAGGRISIGGRAERGTQVVLYIDNRPAGRATADEDGFWRVTPEDEVPPGEHTVRVDQLGPDGSVTARVMIPFMREEIAEPPAAGEYVTVQPGNSLWRIARRAYGDGYSYTVIYKANTDQISDPDLIYPGQIFKLPESE